MRAAVDLADAPRPSRQPPSDGADPRTRTRAVAPLIAAAADEIEAGRELPERVLDALHAAGLFRMLLPRTVGGEEIDPANYAQVIETVAAADASTAWCLSQGCGCSMAAAYVKPRIAAEIWGSDPRAVLAWGQGPGSAAKVVDGGYLVTGEWLFASGGRHASWLGGHCRVEERDGSVRCHADGAPVERTMLFRASSAVMTDVWNVMGLRGTGSDTYEVRTLFVPDDYTLCRDIAEERREPGPLYQFSTTNLYATGFASVALGAARGALDALIALACEKTPSGAARAMRDSPTVQTQVALAEARLQSAQALLQQVLRETWDALSDGKTMTLDRRMQIRMAATFATHQAKEVVDAAFHEAGTSAIFDRNPFERRFRDVHCVTQQVQARYSHFETVGAHLLGLQPDLRFI